MNETTLLYSVILLVGTLIASISQTILKKAAMTEHESRLKEYINFPVLFAYALFFMTTLMSIWAYKGIPLSFGPVLESTSYIYVSIIGVIVFHEKLTAKKTVALLLIISGIGIYALGLR